MMTTRNQVNMSRRAMLAVCGMLLAGGFLFGHAWQNAKVGNAYNEVASLRVYQHIAFRVLELDDSITPHLALVSTTIGGMIEEKRQVSAERLTTAYVILDAGNSQIKVLRVELDVVEQEARQKLEGDDLKDPLSVIEGGRRRLNLVESTYSQLEEQLRESFGPKPQFPILPKHKELEQSTKRAFNRITDDLNRMIQEDMQKQSRAKPNPK